MSGVVPVAAAAAAMTKKTDRVLEAIDQLRRRKARPDSQRICNYLFRRFSVSTSEAKSDLEWCVDNHVVLKVEYKGNISYRNASKRQNSLASHQPTKSIMEQLSESEQLRLKQYRLQQKERKAAAAAIAAAAQQINNAGGEMSSSSITNELLLTGKVNRKFGQLLTNAFGELIVSEPDYLEFGVPAEEIINNILAKDSVRYTKKYISILIEKEVESGGLIQMEGGKYLMGPNVEQTQPERKSSSASDDNNVGGNDGDDDEAFDSSEVNGSIQKKYYIHVKPRKKPGPKPGMKQVSSSKENSENGDEKKMENGNLRVGGRRKRAKKVFDPSDTHVPKKRGRPAGSLNKATIEKQLAKMGDEPHNRPESSTSNCSSRDQQQSGGVCSICHNKRGSNERMISCRECMVSAHANCLNGDDMMLRMYPDNTWQCPQCKTCVICYETSDAGNLVVCSVCADGYHANCVQPKIKNTSKWLCINCEMPEELKINEIQSNLTHSLSHSKNSTLNDTEQVSTSPSISGNSSPNYQSPPLSPTPPRLSPQNEILHKDIDACGGSDSQSFKEENDEDDIDPSIPDASNWTAEEVYQYFAQYFPREANIFREQEIDGRSLLLLTRLDVLTNLKLKLGPALKIYKHVVKLQVRRDDPKLYWL